MGILGTMIVILLWATMGLLCIVQNQEQLERLTIGNALTAFLIFMMFGPCFVITNVLEVILTWLGWEDSNDDGHGV
jgi:hypothetical protein